jgi:hypothetical protein
MRVFLSILATALVTTIASFFYISEGPAVAARLPSSVLEPAASVLLSLLALAAAHWAVRRIERSTAAPTIGLATTWLLSAAALALSITSFPWATVDPKRDAYASAVVAMVGFQWIVLIILLVTTTIGLLWAIGAPGDRRGHTVAHNIRLMAAFTGLSAAIVFVVVYVSPRL